MRTITLMAVGDISLQTLRNEPPFNRIKAVFEEADILFGNLETVISNRGTPAEKSVVLSASPDKILYMKEAGFDVLNLANNHILDRGPEGFDDTLLALSEHGLPFIGVGNSALSKTLEIIERKGLRVGFLGYSESGGRYHDQGIYVNRVDTQRIISDILSIKPDCDFAIVSLHWGIEKVFYPAPEQIALARALVDAGATVVLGHHPHVIQGIERYKDGLIAYSLGNFQFEFDPEECSSKHSKRTGQSYILKIELSENGIESYDTIPIKISREWLPYIPSKEEQDEINSFIARASEPIYRGTIKDSWWFEEIATEYMRGNLKSFIHRIRLYGFKHFIQCIRWLIRPFCLRCYFAMARRTFKQIAGKDEPGLD